MNTSHRKAFLFFFGIILLFGLYQYGYLEFLNTESFEDLLSTQTPYAWIIFILLYAIITILFVPVGPFVVLAGALFGAITGALYVFVGAVIGGVISMLISRYFLHDFFDDLCRKKYPRIHTYKESLQNNKQSLLFFLRLTPIIPSNILNYTCGLTRVSMITFIWTFVGVIPGTLFYTYLGTSLMGLTQEKIIILILLALMMIILTYAVRNHLPQKE